MLKIYLADLVYDTVKTNYVVPLNIAYIAAYLQKQHPLSVDITLFKYPKELEKAINLSPPDIIGLSNYSWNERLSHLFFKITKQLNPNVVTVMGGPNIRTDTEGIKAYLSLNKHLDYYILFEGEEPFANLVKQILIKDENHLPPPGCAALIQNKLYFKAVDTKKKSKQIDLPSPYLTGLLDEFLKDPNIIPLLETNRGCPFNCTYCTWGIAALSKVRQRSLETVFDEIDYVAKKSAKQVSWIFCDANFGLLKRDVQIAVKLREITDKFGYPLNVTLWHSKNTGKRNIEIAKLIKDSDGYIAIQSTDPVVLKNCGRGNIQLDDLKIQIDYYKKNSFEVTTDILIGLPGETSDSHLNTLSTAFDLGFEKIHPYNIRMLPGSQYESSQDRIKYGIETKFRPIFGAYGTYNNQNMFEIEESIRATKDMTENELENFKILHWLIYFCWNTNFLKPFLNFAKQHNINPNIVLYKLSFTSNPSLSNLFSIMRKESLSEWFKSREEIIEYYSQQSNFDTMVNNFTKLTFLWIARLFTNIDASLILLKETEKIIKENLIEKEPNIHNDFDNLRIIIEKLLCNNLLEKEFINKEKFSGESLSYVFNNPALSKYKEVDVEIFRDKEDVAFCNYYLNPNGKKDFSLHNLTRFIEARGDKMLTNKIRLVSQNL